MILKIIENDRNGQNDKLENDIEIQRIISQNIKSSLATSYYLKSKITINAFSLIWTSRKIYFIIYSWPFMSDTTVVSRVNHFQK